MKTFKNLKITGLLMGVLLMTQTASASLLVEPHIAYNLSASGDGTPTVLKYDYSYNGVQYGARLGYQQLGFMTGLDYTRSSFDLKEETGGVSIKNSVDRNEWGIFVGYDFPILVRAWGTYYFSNKTEKPNGDIFSGNTKELGVGFTGLPFLSINVMYRMVTFEEYKSGSTTTNYKKDININEFVLGVSLPLNL